MVSAASTTFAGSVITSGVSNATATIVAAIVTIITTTTAAATAHASAPLADVVGWTFGFHILINKVKQTCLLCIDKAEVSEPLTGHVAWRVLRTPAP